MTDLAKNNPELPPLPGFASATHFTQALLQPSPFLTEDDLREPKPPALRFAGLITFFYALAIIGICGAVDSLAFIRLRSLEDVKEIRWTIVIFAADVSTLAFLPLIGGILLTTRRLSGRVLLIIYCSATPPLMLAGLVAAPGRSSAAFAIACRNSAMDILVSFRHSARKHSLFLFLCMDYF